MRFPEHGSNVRRNAEENVMIYTRGALNFGLYEVIICRPGLYVYLAEFIECIGLTYLRSYLLIYLLTYLLTSWSRVLSEKLTCFNLVKKFSAFYGTRNFITSFTLARHLSLSWSISIQSIPPHPTSWRSILVLHSHLSWVSHAVSFPQVSQPNFVYVSLLPHTCCMPAHLILLDFITRKILSEEYKSFSSSLCRFLHSLVTSSLLGTNVLLNTLFSNSLSLRSSLSVSDHVSHPHKTTGKIIFLYILIFKFEIIFFFIYWAM